MEGEVSGREPAFLRWLALAALVDWLITRTLARAAIFMPKAPPVLAVYQALILGGQVASALGALLALLGMGWLAWQFWKGRKGLLSLALLALAIFSLVSLAIPPEGPLHLMVHLLYLVAIVWIIAPTWRRTTSAADKIAVLVPALALFTGGLYQASQILYSAFGLPGSPGFALGLFNLGELFVVLTPIGIWWVYWYLGYARGGGAVSLRRDGTWWVRSVTLPLQTSIPAIGFAAFTLANPSMAGILAIWSTGLTLYLPWPVYALSLWLFGATFLALRKQDHPAAWALLLLAAGGFAPQLSSQIFYGLIGLSLFSIYTLKSDLPVSSIWVVAPTQVGSLSDFRNASSNDFETVV
jgi:hypothetical protein